MRASAAAVAAALVTEIEGVWQRHVAGRHQDQALDGRRGRGRWSTATSFPVLYLGRPRDSIIVEAYRHLIDPVEDNIPVLAPRVLVTAVVRVTAVLDLRTAGGRLSVGLTKEQLTSATTDSDAYAACQNVAAVAHQLGRHGLIAPAATSLGDTLVLFTDQLPNQERPRRHGDDEYWETLPEDPRSARTPRLRVVRGPG